MVFPQKSVDKSIFTIKKIVSYLRIVVNFSYRNSMELTISELTALWDRTLSKIKTKLADNIVYDSFFAESYIHSIEGNKIIVVVNSGLAATIIKINTSISLILRSMK